MDSGTVIVLVLTAGVVAFLIWVEVNSRRNEAREKQSSNLAPPTPSPVPKEIPNRVASDQTKAA